MYPKWHITSSIFIAVISLMFDQTIPFISISLLNFEIGVFFLCLIAGVAIDVDHLLDYHVHGVCVFKEESMIILFHGIENIGINDNFFEMGGDSIKAIQVIARLQKYRLKLEISNLFLQKIPCILTCHAKININIWSLTKYLNIEDADWFVNIVTCRAMSSMICFISRYRMNSTAK